MTNFNKQFKQITGKTPSAYREEFFRVIVDWNIRLEPRILIFDSIEKGSNHNVDAFCIFKGIVTLSILTLHRFYKSFIVIFDVDNVSVID